MLPGLESAIVHLIAVSKWGCLPAWRRGQTKLEGGLPARLFPSLPSPGQAWGNEWLSRPPVVGWRGYRAKSPRHFCCGQCVLGSPSQWPSGLWELIAGRERWCTANAHWSCGRVKWIATYLMYFYHDGFQIHFKSKRYYSFISSYSCVQIGCYAERHIAYNSYFNLVHKHSVLGTRLYTAECWTYQGCNLKLLEGNCAPSC